MTTIYLSDSTLLPYSWDGITFHGPDGNEIFYNRDYIEVNGTVIFVEDGVEPRIKDLYLHAEDDKHIATNDHGSIVAAHNALVEMVLALRRRVKELEREQ